MKRRTSADAEPSSTSTRDRTRRIALIYDATAAYDVKVMKGVAAYIQKYAKWNVYIEENVLRDQHLPSLRTWKGDGIIANFDHPGVARQVMRSGLPAVAFGSGYGWYSTSSEIPYFYTNNANISHLAAEHFIEKGLRHFAFCGYPANAINGWCLERRQAFDAQLSRRGFACHSYPAKHSAEQTWASLLSALGVWLRALPRPVGIFAANDVRGRQLLECCRESGLKVPGEISVLGVDNDELLCGLSSPLLSSIEQGAVRLGYEAAKLLDGRMHAAREPCSNRFVIDAVGVVARASTDILAIEDEAVAKALGYIAANFGIGLCVDDVASAAGVSRSTLEKRFRSLLGYSIGVAVRKARLERARQIVLTTSLPLKEISANMGFPSVQHMTTLFRKGFGHPPRELRLTRGPQAAQIHKPIPEERKSWSY